MESAAGVEATEAELVEICWRAGDLSYLLHDGQRELREAWQKSWPRGRLFVVCCARRWGKSYWLDVECVQECIRAPKRLVRMGAPTAKACRNIHEPHMRDILEDCPEDMRPTYSRHEGIWRFPNGSEFHLVGCDNGGHERLRGTNTHLGALDEAGFTGELRYIVKSILTPQTMTVDGHILVASTPAKTPAHDFTGLYELAAAEGRGLHRTIYEAPHISAAQIAEYMREEGGEETSGWKREYLAQFVVDQDLAVVPEFAQHEDACVYGDGTPLGDIERPTYAAKVVSIDTGFHDLTVAAFGYYHFPLAKIVVEDELVLRHSTAATIRDACIAKEVALWGGIAEDHRPELQPRRRFGDMTPMDLAEMSTETYPWAITRKDEKGAQINALRQAIPSELRIHERCKVIRSHLRHGIWNKRRTEFERSDAFGHFDGVDAVVYLVRNVDRQHNPFPSVPDGVTQDDHYVPVSMQGPRGDEAVLASIFKKQQRKRRRR